MPQINRNPGTAGSETMNGTEESQPLHKGLWLKPDPPVRVDSSFKPTGKSQSGKFTDVPQTDRPLPRFNARKLKNRFTKTVRVGVRNPYALVNRLMAAGGFTVYDWDRMTAKECRDRLVQHLGHTTNNTPLRYEDLFDPKYGSRLYSRTIKQILTQIQMGVPSDAGNVHVQTGAPLPSDKGCRDAAKWMEPDPAIPWINNPENVASPNPSFDAPQQGTADDCWFIAALSSIAWVNPDMLKATNNDGIFVLDTSSALSGTDLLNASYIFPDDTLPYALEAPATSHNFWWSWSKYPERWVAMMEKAFAMQYLPSGSTTPQICELPRGDPQYALYVLLGDMDFERYWNVTPDYGAPCWTNENGTETYITSKLRELIQKNCSSYTDSGFMKTKRPTVAFTYDSGNPPAPVLPNGGTLQYKNDVLVASHSYSLLGLFIENEKYYVVLRNPWGKITGISYADHASLPYSGGSLATGPLDGFYHGTNPQRLWSGQTITNTSTPLLGMFALDMGTFARYFRGFSWV